MNKQEFINLLKNDGFSDKQIEKQINIINKNVNSNNIDYSSFYPLYKLLDNKI